MTIANTFTELLGCRHPLQNAGMGTASPALAYAVASAGGVGTLSGVGPTPDQLERIVSGPEVPQGAVLGVNFLMPFLEDLAPIERVANHVRLVEFFYGNPDSACVERVHDGGALASWQVGSVDEAQMAVDAGCDLIVLQGIEAGGHVRGTRGLFSLLAEVRDVIDIPIIAAGGISNARGVAMALACGAQAVRIGTRFVATPESGYHPQYVQAIINADADATQYTEKFSVGWEDAPQRVLRSSIEAAEQSRDEIVAKIKFGDAEVDVPKFSFFAPTVDTQGDVSAMAQYCGQGVGLVNEILPAADIVDDLMSGAEQLLATGL
ncbi:MAG: NAD(P)H-dependent flavin oxidoreductase [Gammaproteobacteria bacterium]